MSRFERWSLWSSGFVVSVTGFGLLWTKYLMESDDPWSAINHPSQPWLLKAHILAAPLLVFAVGLVATRHIWPHVRARLSGGRVSGTITALLVTPAVMSGYLIQAITDPAWLSGAAMVHIATGILLALGLALHPWMVRAGRREASEAKPECGHGSAAETRREPAGVLSAD